HYVLYPSRYVLFCHYCCRDPRSLPSFPTRRSSDLDESEIIVVPVPWEVTVSYGAGASEGPEAVFDASFQVDLLHQKFPGLWKLRSEEHTSELQSRENLVCRLLLEEQEGRVSSQIHH